METKGDIDGKMKRWLGLSPARALVMLAAAAALVSLTYLLVEDVRSLRVAGLLTPIHHARELLRPRAKGASLLSPEHPDPAAVQEWMTFDYVNMIFGVDQEYLKAHAGVSGGRYPRVSIKRYARLKGEDAAAVLERVRAAMRELEASRQGGGTL